MTSLPREALYLPFEAGPHRMVMGLVARPPNELIELDERSPEEMAERRALADIRARAPLHADHLSAPVDRLVRHLKAGKLAERLNWSVTDDPAPFQVEGKHRAQPGAADRPAAAVRTLPTAMAAYKSSPSFRLALQGYLAEAAGSVRAETP